MQVLKNALGCDFVVDFPIERKDTKIKLLQLTDMQIIDSEQRRTPDRLRDDEIIAWSPSRFNENCGDYVRSLIASTSPDLIFITGDMVYGSFDDNGTVMEWFCELMDSFSIPWAPVFGNHDNESARGVDWQCGMLEKAKYCIFKRGEVTGNSNYSLGISVGGELIRVMYMLDSNGAKNPSDPLVIAKRGIYPDQLEWVAKTAASIEEKAGRSVPSFMAFHFPTSEFREAEIAKGYRTEERVRYVIGVDTPSLDGDFGCCCAGKAPIEVDGFKNTLSVANTEAVFVGHCHAVNTVITYGKVTYAYGLKTGQYDYHNPYQLGGTLVRIDKKGFEISHAPALVMSSGFPGDSKIFDGLFVEN